MDFLGGYLLINPEIASRTNAMVIYTYLSANGVQAIWFRTIRKDGVSNIIPVKKKADAISAAVEKIRNRIDIYGVKETSIQVQGVDSILVQVPGIVNREMVDTLKKVGKLEFKIVEENQEQMSLALKGAIHVGYE